MSFISDHFYTDNEAVSQHVVERATVEADDVMHRQGSALSLFRLVETCQLSTVSLERKLVEAHEVADREADRRRMLIESSPPIQARNSCLLMCNLE